MIRLLTLTSLMMKWRNEVDIMTNNSLKKSSMARLTEMLSNTKNAYFQNLIMDIYNLAK